MARHFTLAIRCMPPNPNIGLANLYSDHKSWLKNLLQRHAGCSELAADLARDTFLRLLARNEDAAAIREPRAYLQRIGRGLLANHWRRRDIERAYLDSLAHLSESLATDPETHHRIIVTLCRIDAMLQGLPVQVRRAFLLARLDGLSYAEIAHQLKVSERTVKNHMAQAMLHCLQVQAELL